MADFRNMLGSDEDSNEDMDHIPKTPGPPLISSDHDSDEEKSGGEEEEGGKEEEPKNNGNNSDSDSDSSSSQSDSSNDNNRNSRNDSEVERSDNEIEEKEDNEEVEERGVNREPAQIIDANEANVDMSSDDNEDNEDNNIIKEQESQHNEEEEDSDDEEIVRRKSPKKKRQLEDNSDSSEDESAEPKKQRTESSDKEDNEDSDKNEDNEDRDEEMADKSAKAKDIFGELSSEDEDEDEDKGKDKPKDDDEKDSDKDSDVNENKDNERRDDESGDEVNRDVDGEQPFIEDEPPEEPIPETRIEVEIPRIVADLGRETHFVKLPNFLSIDTHPYDPQWYEEEIDEDENLDDEGRARLKLKVENTIRWRNALEKDTNDLKRESNTRVVRWSDGTFSLYLGEEIFDIHKLQLMTGDNNHLFIRQGTGLQGQQVFRTKLNFRPFSTESFTHRKLTLSLADRSQKTQKIRVLPNVGKDPEAHRTEMIKKEEDRLKASIRRENKQRRVRERSLIRGPTASYLEPDGDEDEEEGGISIARIKNQYKRGSFNKSYDDPELSDEESKPANEEDDSDDEDIFRRKSSKKKIQLEDNSD